MPNPTSICCAKQRCRETKSSCRAGSWADSGMTRGRAGGPGSRAYCPSSRVWPGYCDLDTAGAGRAVGCTSFHCAGWRTRDHECPRCGKGGRQADDGGGGPAAARAQAPAYGSLRDDHGLARRQPPRSDATRARRKSLSGARRPCPPVAAAINPGMIRSNANKGGGYMRTSLLLRSIAAAALVSAALVGAASALEVGQKAPDFELNGVDGKPVKLSDLTAKGPVVVYTFIAAFTPT